MAIVLKDGKTWTDNRGNDQSNSYGVIDEVSLNKDDKHAFFTLEIYKNQAARAQGKRSQNYGENVDGADYLAYFKISELNPAGKNPFKNSYQYLLTETTWGDDWESDE